MTSDIHFDLRPVFDGVGLLPCVDAFVLSYEQVCRSRTRPSSRPRFDELDIEGHEALMVGDRGAFDGAAVTLGIPVLLVPPLQNVTEKRLDLVLGACGVPYRGR
ncbi:MAG: hypothetical protein ACRDPK_14245 [Carbonactinosporaceae bacterium]